MQKPLRRHLFTAILNLNKPDLDSVFVSEWIDAVEFRKRLNIGRTTQWHLIKSGTLKPVVHYFRTGNGSRAVLRFNYPACEFAFGINTQS